MRSFTGRIALGILAPEAKPPSPNTVIDENACRPVRDRKPELRVSERNLNEGGVSHARRIPTECVRARCQETNREPAGAQRAADGCLWGDRVRAEQRQFHRQLR